MGKGSAFALVFTTLLSLVLCILIITTCVYGWRFDVAIWGTVGQWASATATTLAVVVALSGDRLRRLVLKPRIELTLPHPRGVDVLTGVMGSDERPLLPVQVRWLHIRVFNPTRWFPIRDVEVYLLHLEQLDQGEWVELCRGPFQLTWRSGKLPTRNIGPAWEADILRVHGRAMSFATVREGLIPSITSMVKLRAVLQATGLELDSGEVVIEIDWNGSSPGHGCELLATVSPSQG